MWVKNKLLVSFIPIFSTSVIIGSGFAFWAFDSDANNSYASIGIPINITAKAILGHFSGVGENKNLPVVMVFDEGTSPTDLNEGIEFYKSKEHEATGAQELVLDDLVSIEFHKDASFNEANYGLVFKIGASVNIYSDSDATAKLTDFIKINSDLFVSGDFVDLTEYFTKSETTFKHEGEYASMYPGDFYNYTYDLHLNDLFSYLNEEVKPITEAAYIKLYTAFKENVFIEKPKWRIDINFTCHYSETSTNAI